MLRIRQSIRTREKNVCVEQGERLEREDVIAPGHGPEVQQRVGVGAQPASHAQWQWPGEIERQEQKKASTASALGATGLLAGTAQSIGSEPQSTEIGVSSTLQHRRQAGKMP